MDATRAKHRFTIIEFVVVIVIIVVVTLLLLPVLNARREAQRRASCMNRVGHQIGLAMQNHLATFNVFPPAASVIKSPDGKQTVGGFSFLVRLLSFTDYEPPYRSLPLSLPRGTDPENLANQKDVWQQEAVSRSTVEALVAWIESQPKEFLCPSSPRGRQSSGIQPSAGITNYKAMGASTRGSLVFAANPQATPPYGTTTIHPDGMIFPGLGIRASECVDGLRGAGLQLHHAAFDKSG